MRIRSIVQDYPAVVTAAIALVVGGHWTLASHTDLPEFASTFAAHQDAWAMYLGFAGFIAVLAGFSGIVIVFAMTPGSERLARLRRQGGERLEANWLSPMLSSFLATAAASLATLLAFGGKGTAAAWAFEFAVLTSVNAAVRLAWLMRALMKTVRREDEATAKPPVSLSSILSDSERHRVDV